MALMEEILKGAHIVVRSDRGAFYSYFTQMQVSWVVVVIVVVNGKRHRIE